MSAWNTTSHGNDHVHDNLVDENNPHPPESACRANVCYIFSDDFVADRVDSCESYAEHRSCQLGVVIWYLEHGCTVKQKYIEKAIKCAEYLLKHEDYLNNWKKPEERKNELKKELRLLKKNLPKNLTNELDN